MSRLEQIAWDLYCEETAGSMDARDFWRELSTPVQQLYLRKAQQAMAGTNWPMDRSCDDD